MCGGCGYVIIYKPIQGKNRYRRFECSRHSVLKMPECCTYYRAEMLEELVMTMVNKELMLRGNATKQVVAVADFQKSHIVAAKRELKGLRSELRRVQASKDAFYESYASGGMAPGKYRQSADEMSGQMDSLIKQINCRQEQLSCLEEEVGKLEEDMKKIIRYSHIGELTHELVDAFIKRIYVYKDKKVEIEWTFGEG